jgi:hypothetical protein
MLRGLLSKGVWEVKMDKKYEFKSINELKAARIIRDRWKLSKDTFPDNILVSIVSDSLEYQRILIHLCWLDLLRAIKDALPNWLKWIIYVPEVEEDETN